ncbi:NADH-quinone oxidoreductase subunit 2 [bacterium BMS3Abin07]|nr:NADH-quinone oxidoreductase subunit 2 [bacterium BMS3Abin07]GBE32471.1 NADH-quinone oxidoreductase subunit 2 [bacterium BMS3Bbin05]HDL20992.1 NADH-quinone oxidoreductase subunit NuoE [Nitrospirota bacterium]HDO22951.1 NADH-quinone oxidoreductase subunit NuoE [Nitrospirota bacterium]HDZ87208.1 NADH-quinone oxidoreductase subunit NuoE [Nitrospirota bacterium]
MITEEIIKKIQQKKGDYPVFRSAIMSALHEIQNTEGWLSQESLYKVSGMLNIPPATVKGVATFYHMYRHVPMGRNIIQICTNVACMIMGAEKLVDLLKREFGIEAGGTTGDKRFSLVIMECIGACGTAPAMLVNDDFHDNLDEKRVMDILNGYK